MIARDSDLTHYVQRHPRLPLSYVLDSVKSECSVFITTAPFLFFPMQMGMGEEEEVEDEDMGVAETYADYMPTKRE